MMSSEAGFGDLPLGGEPRQHRGREETRRANLALVEGLVRSRENALVQPGQRHLGLAAEQPGDDEIAEPEQEPGGVQPDRALAVRKVCTLALSFDHRMVDGDLGSAVLRDIGAMLTDPLRMLAWS